MVPFPFGWTSNSNGIEYVLALYQEETAWGNAARKILALLLPLKRGKEQGPPKTIQHPVLLLYLLPLKRGGGERQEKSTGNHVTARSLCHLVSPCAPGAVYHSQSW